MPTFLTLTLLIISSVSFAEERITIKSRKSKQIVAPAGNSTYAVELSEEKEHVNGNSGYGFFYTDRGGNQGYCRIRAKVSCDYGLGVTKPVRGKIAWLHMKKGIFNQQLDNEGLLDMIFKCQKDTEKENVKLKILEYESSFKLADAPKEVVIPGDKCK